VGRSSRVELRRWGLGVDFRVVRVKDADEAMLKEALRRRRRVGEAEEEYQ